MNKDKTGLKHREETGLPEGRWGGGGREIEIKRAFTLTSMRDVQNCWLIILHI